MHTRIHGRGSTPALVGILLLPSLLCGGCTSSPIAPGYRQAARFQPPFATLRANPGAFRGKSVLLGGSVVKTVNLPKVTEIEVLQQPLDRQDDSPSEGDQSQGRFLARCPGFLDAAVYAKGRDVTVAGIVLGREERDLDQTRYSYPVIDCQSVYLWPKQPPATYYYPPYYYGGPWWYGPGFYPYWYPYW